MSLTVTSSRVEQKTAVFLKSPAVNNGSRVSQSSVPILGPMRSLRVLVSAGSGSFLKKLLTAALSCVALSVAVEHSACPCAIVTVLVAVLVLIVPMAVFDAFNDLHISISAEAKGSFSEMKLSMLVKDLARAFIPNM